MVLKNLSDDEVFQGLLSHDLEILDAIYAQCYPMVRKLVTQNMGTEEDAKDIFQEGIIAMLQKALTGKWDIKHQFSTYFYGVCRNLWGLSLRKNKGEKITLDEVQGELSHDVFDSLEQDTTRSQRMALLKKHVKHLPKDCRNVLRFFWEGNSMKEIAEKMDISPNYAKKRKFVCQRKLIESIENDPFYFELLP